MYFVYIKLCLLLCRLGVHVFSTLRCMHTNTAHFFLKEQLILLLLKGDALAGVVQEMHWFRGKMTFSTQFLCTLVLTQNACSYFDSCILQSFFILTLNRYMCLSRPLAKQATQNSTSSVSATRDAQTSSPTATWRGSGPSTAGERLLFRSSLCRPFQSPSSLSSSTVLQNLPNTR